MANCIYKYKGKDYTKEEFYSLVSNSNFIQQEQTHILGSKQDIENFANFVKNNNVGDIENMQNYINSKSIDYIMNKLIKSGKIEKKC